MGVVLGPAIEGAEGLSLVARIEKGDDLASVARAARAQVVVDFTTPEAAVANARAVLAAGCHGVIGTTGFLPRDLEDLDARARASGKGLLVAPNFALGAIVAKRLAVLAARHFSRAEVVELHHDAKKDAPSGTAVSTAEALAAAGAGGGRGAEPSRGEDRGGVRVHSVRLPGLLAHQEVLFGAPGEVLSIRHDATSRECYVAGVILGIREMARGARTGVVRGLEAVIPA
jgi:4-hydroxy-tetrahydrodipicolinate reductase